MIAAVLTTYWAFSSLYKWKTTIITFPVSVHVHCTWTLIFWHAIGACSVVDNESNFTAHSLHFYVRRMLVPTCYKVDMDGNCNTTCKVMQQEGTTTNLKCGHAAKNAGRY